jgi:hypothetical protein
VKPYVFAVFTDCFRDPFLTFLTFFLSVTRDMSGFVTHNLSGLLWSPLEVTDETDGDTTGEPEDAI